MKKIINLFLITLIILTIINPVHADRLFINKGDEIDGTLEKINGNKIYFKVDDKTQIYDKKDVVKLMLLQKKKIVGEDKKSQIKDKELINILNNLPDPKDYPNAGDITLLEEESYTLNPDMSSEYSSRVVKYIFKERSIKKSNVRFYYLKDKQSAEILYARAINGEEIDYLDDSSISDASENYYYPQYENLRSIKFSIPKVNIGSVIEYKYTVKTKKHDITFPFKGKTYFKDYEPIMISRLNVKVPPGTEINIDKFNLPKDIVEKIDTKNGTYFWENKNIKELITEDNMPPFSHFAPQINFVIKMSWKEINDYFYEKITKNLVYNNEIKTKVQELTKDIKEPLLKVEALYNWLVKEIKISYVFMSDFSYIPKFPVDIFKAKTGNYLDKTYLFYCMLKLANFDPKMVYLSYKSNRINIDLPMINNFFMAGVLVNVNNKDYLITPYYDNYRYNEIIEDLQDTYGLVIDKTFDSKTSILKTPLKDCSDESTNSYVKMYIDEKGNIFVDEKDTFKGNEQASIRSYKDYTPEELEKQIQKIVHSIHTNATVDSYKIENLNDLSKDISFNIKYNVKDYALKAGKKLILFRIPGLSNFSAYEVGKPTRDFPIYWTKKTQTINKVEITIPNGYKVYYIPKELNLETSGYSVNNNYKLENGEIIFSNEIKREKLLIPEEEYSKYKEVIEKTAKYFQEWIILEHE